VHEVKCLSCTFRGPMPETLERVRAGEDDPHCLDCGGILKSATISFGENLVPADLERAQRAAQNCDVFLAVGTSLGVYPAAALPEFALNAGARLVVMNAQETPFDRVAAAVSNEQLGTVLPELVALV
jgi:NAD-dependent deacetylase